MAKPSCRSCVALTAPFLIAAVHAQDTHGSVRNTPEMTFAASAVMPACMLGSVVDGDPAKGAFVVAVRASAECVVPWHWHSASERLMMVSGSAKVQMKDGKAAQLSPGGYVFMPPKHVHRFTCTSKCMLYVQSDQAFDMHYVDAQGNEIATEQALKGAKKAKKTK